MNELSTEVKAKEIHENAQFWHNRTGFNLYKFLLEIKKIRDERYYKELGHSTFEEYCSNEWNLSRQTVYERIQMAEELNEQDFVSYSGQYGHKKTLFLSVMEEPQRKQALTDGVPTDEGYKPYDEATQKEIAEWKRNSEEAERKAEEYQKQLEQAQRSQDILQNKLDEAENKEPDVIEKYSEPDDYQELKNDLNRMKQQEDSLQKNNEKLLNEIANMRTQRSELDEKSNKYDQLNEEINKMNGRLTKGQQKIKAQKEVYDLIKSGNRAVTELAPLSYLVDSENVLESEYAQKPIKQLINNLEDISKRLRSAVNNETIIGG